MCILVLLLLCGCTEKRYPNVEYNHNAWEMWDKNSQRIPIPDGYTLNQGHAYDIVKTEDGYPITLYLIKD